MSALIITDADGRKRGADPREMTGEQIEAAGIMRQPVLAAIRAKCIDCCCGQIGEVAAREGASVTTSERRKRDFERHHAFLENVTGIRFGAPRFDPCRQGVLFPSFGFVSNGDVRGLVRIESLITDVKDFTS